MRSLPCFLHAALVDPPQRNTMKLYHFLANYNFCIRWLAFQFEPERSCYYINLCAHMMCVASIRNTIFFFSFCACYYYRNR